ncbi:chromosome partitioning protein ParA [Photobacterium atrarenae]|uniref:Chromosome partitioning protein ParA n=1 Tax=Photobacterium atrarenae TaxID=865757 RepID=A0ABY5GPL4_9GAMM|nr:chromosome partitioning protein ParA [Photobacterium atrarenae]UTV30858.1 chromosome partitioning protein ParA [Photobacterium atrarenae]
MITRSEFSEFRIEMRTYMKQHTELMGQMIEMQTKHNSLESQVVRLDEAMGELEKRMRPLESATVSTKYNRDLIWVLLLFVVGIASWKLRGG